MDGLEHILREKYDPTNPLLQEPLQAPVSLGKAEELSAINEDNKASPVVSQAALEINISPVTKALLDLIKKLEKD